MSKWEKTKSVRGIATREVALDVLGWSVGHATEWTYEFWGRRLKRHGWTVAEGLTSARDAVLYSMAYETALADAKALSHSTPNAFRGASKEDAILPFMKAEEASDR